MPRSLDLRPPKTVQDLMTVTGLGRTAVKEAIVRGELPGAKVGSRYVVPAEAFDAFCRGEWQAQPRPIAHRPVTVAAPVDFLHRKGA